MVVSYWLAFAVRMHLIIVSLAIPRGFLNMTDKLLSVIRHVHNEIFIAASYFNLYRQLYDCFADRGTRPDPVGLLTLQAYLDSMVLHLSSVLKVDKQATNFDYLLNLSETHSNSFKAFSDGIRSAKCGSPPVGVKLTHYPG